MQPTTESPIPSRAQITVGYSISLEGKLTAVVFNCTDEIMTIDQTKSFFVNTDGKSVSYYDPTVRTTSTTDISSRTSGASVNLGAVTGALGLGGPLQQIANGVNVGGSGTSGSATTETTYIADQPQVSLAPHSNGAMSKVFTIAGLNSASINASNLTYDNSPIRFSVCISYSVDGGQTFEKLVTDFYVNSNFKVGVTKHGQVSEPLRSIYTRKPDALNEFCWQLRFNENPEAIGSNSKNHGVLFDYQ